MVLKMQKEFTIAVPDEYWVDSWTENKTMTWVYQGPDTLYILLDHQEIIKSWSQEEIVRDESTDVEKVRILHAEEDLAAAHWLTSLGRDHQYQYAESTNHDGSIYRYYTNPRIRDLFELFYSSNTGFRLEPIYKNTETWCEREAKKRKEFVKKYHDLYEFGEEINNEVRDYFKKIDDYLGKMEKIYPWKYAEISGEDIPKIPIRLLDVLKLPNYGENQ